MNTENATALVVTGPPKWPLDPDNRDKPIPPEDEEDLLRIREDGRATA